ncbi:MAG: YbhB/YbcL family Raf kinase inhibitor-like protein [Proteobacteria bacterium]|nr:YbhB/YbcL family Raf kinase inhibitor-like protein [Pseudomonadota bacterium]
MILTSPAFKNGEHLPRMYTCDGENISPPFSFGEIPKNTKSLVFIHDDPEAIAGNWTHWILFNLPPSLNGLEENIKKLPNGVKVGKNSWGKLEYGGACPPDKEHRYEFKLYALDCILSLENGASKEEVEQAMVGHVLEEVLLSSPYKRPFH